MTDTTQKKIENILNEIGASVLITNEILDTGKKTTKEIVDIMLLKKDDISDIINDNACLQYEKIESSKYNLDMEELNRWREKNNESYEVKSWFLIRSHRKILGRFIVFGKKFVRKFLKWYIEPIVEQQNKFNGSATASINALFNNELVTEAFILEYESEIKNFMDFNSVKFEEKFSALQQVQIDIKEEMNERELAVREEMNERELVVREEMNERELIVREEFLFEISEKNKLIENLKNQIDNNLSEMKQEIIDKLETQINILASEDQNTIKICLDNMDKIKNLEQKIDAEIDYLNFKLYKEKQNKSDDIKVVGENIAVNNLEIQMKESASDGDVYGRIDYFKFENYFRGSRKYIKKNQEIYIKYFNGKENVIDIGCGRGEFLELLKENQVDSLGVDIYDEFVEYCNYKELKALKCDAIEYISNLDDDSIGGCFAAQLAEHLKTEQLITLCNQTYKKLKNGCCFILETPNPTCLSIYTNAFYVDPSHEKPVHPKTLEYFLKEAGFKDIEIIFTDSSKSGYRLPMLEASQVANLAEFNDSMNFLSDILFGSQDYAIVARK